jgi:hypothetical protein
MAMIAARIVLARCWPARGHGHSHVSNAAHDCLSDRQRDEADFICANACRDNVSTIMLGLPSG